MTPCSARGGVAEEPDASARLRTPSAIATTRSTTTAPPTIQVKALRISARPGRGRRCRAGAREHRRCPDEGGRRSPRGSQRPPTARSAPMRARSPRRPARGAAGPPPASNVPASSPSSQSVAKLLFGLSSSEAVRKRGRSARTRTRPCSTITSVPAGQHSGEAGVREPGDASPGVRVDGMDAARRRIVAGQREEAVAGMAVDAPLDELAVANLRECPVGLERGSAPANDDRRRRSRPRGEKPRHVGTATTPPSGLQPDPPALASVPSGESENRHPL